MPQSIAQDAYDVLLDERLAASEGKLLDTQAERFIDLGSRVLETQQLQAIVARLRAFQAERAGQVAGRAGMKP